MAYPNPHYDPDWETLHDRHDEERTRASEEMERLAKAGEMRSDAYDRAKAEFKRHHEAACHTLLKKQHPTVQEYAEWLFREFRVDAEDFGAGIPVPEVDFAEFRTIEEVDAAWRRIHTAISNSAHEKRASLPVGQPTGLKAFADPASPSLMRFWRHFLPRELYPVGYAGEFGVRTLVTADRQEDGWHVCFMHDWDSPGMSVTNEIERLATAFYRETCPMARQPAARRRWVAWLARRLLRRKPAVAPDPGRFHFYQHILPNPQGCRETFDRILLRFWQGEYRDPKWFSYRVIPEVIQSARLERATDVSRPSWALRISDDLTSFTRMSAL